MEAQSEKTSTSASMRAMPAVNLLPPLRRQARHHRMRARVWFGICVSCAVILAGIYSTWSTVWVDDNRDLSDELRRVNDDIEHNNRAIANAQQTGAEQNVTLEIDKAIWNQPDWSLLLGLLTRLCGEQIVLSRVSLESQSNAPSRPVRPVSVTATSTEPEQTKLDAERIVIGIEGFGRSTTAVTQFVLRMEELGFFDSVTQVKATRESFLSGDALAFRIECGIKPDGGAK